MKSHLNRVLQDLEMDLDIIIENKRCQYPTAYYFPYTDSYKIVANKPSLIRYALAHLILHEVSHRDYVAKKAGDGDNEAWDHHLDPQFQQLLRENEALLDHLILTEHE